MKTVEGRMVVNTIDGRYGAFNVATLYSDIGNYVVRYDALDEFRSGTYEGEFIVRNTMLRTRDFGVGKIIEPIAFLDDMNLFDADENKQEDIPDAIPDPIEEESSTVVDKPKNDLTHLKTETERPSHSEVVDLFGELWPLQEKLKLDATVGRATLRLQKEYLETQADYIFIAKHQVWIKNH
ncbi:hypothetical protein MNBD_GAMMA11-1341 [hydrothermal vent metagenome]|uniref:DUF3275 family protein n=1 Tax=hydrothermal vent metagenome TaxID=652676 RepID=A0A3B0Y7Z4_9ZZZZ